MDGPPIVTAADVLDIWEERWGKLSLMHRASFLRRPEVRGLTQHHETRVVNAVAIYRKLVEILDHVNAVEAILASEPLHSPRATRRTRSRRSVVCNTDGSRLTPSLRREGVSTVRPPLSRPSTADGSTLPPLLRSERVGALICAEAPGGTLARHHTGLVHAAGNIELAVGERCSVCGAFQPSGSIHDCT